MPNTADRDQTSVVYQPSETAMSTAFMRALAAHDPREEIRCKDNLAELFLTEDRKRPVQDPAVRQWVMKNKLAPGMYEFMIARTAFFDAVVAEAFRDGVPQIVFLGAGYDSRPYRFRDIIGSSRIFELDALPTQQRKQEVLRGANIPIPPQLTFVSIDFNTNALADVLLPAGFDKHARALFVWEGVTYYLTARVVDETLSGIRSIAHAGSSLCFDYAALSKEALKEEGVQQVRTILRSEHASEPTRFGIPAGTIESFLSARGYAVKEHLAYDQIEGRYLTLPDGSSAGKVPALFCFVNAPVCG